VHVVGIGCLGSRIAGLMSAESYLGHAVLRRRFRIVGLVFFVDCVGVMLVVSHPRFASTAIMR